MALTCSQFDLRKELLFPIKCCLCSDLILLLLQSATVMLGVMLLKMVHLHGTWGGWTRRLKRVASTLRQVLPQHLLRCLLVTILLIRCCTVGLMKLKVLELSVSGEQ